jgi:hypothetical protein
MQSRAAPAKVGSVASGSATPFLAHATDFGPMSQSSPIEITVWLKLRDDSGLEGTLSKQRAIAVGWLSDEQIEARYAPAISCDHRVAQSSQWHALSIGQLPPDPFGGTVSEVGQPDA